MIRIGNAHAAQGRPSAGRATQRCHGNATARETKPSHAVVIVDHGSKKSAANSALDEVVRMYRASRSDCFVTKAHMELASPSIMDAIRECRDTAGVDTVIVAPYFLSNGRHVQEDIPQLVKEAEEELGVRCVVAGHLGLDAGLVKVIMDRVDAAYDTLT
jgi:sirohydrochlorin ferrochelatase